MYTMKDVEMIFEKEKILIGDRDVLPEYEAINIFGEKAVDFARDFKHGRNSNTYGIGDFELRYLTLAGVRTAATHVNICSIRNSAVEKGGACNA